MKGEKVAAALNPVFSLINIPPKPRCLHILAAAARPQAQENETHNLGIKVAWHSLYGLAPQVLAVILKVTALSKAVQFWLFLKPA